MKKKDCSDSEPEAPDRLKRYGLEASEDVGDALVVEEGEHIRLFADGRDDPGPGRIRLEPKSMDDVKRWIGVPDELGARRSGKCRLPAEIPGLESSSDLRKLDPSSRLNLQDLAHEFVHGDSRPLKSYEPLLMKLLDRSWIVGWYFRKDIDIYPGAVLEVGGGTKVLFARHIRIWTGGTLKVTGDATIDCVSIRGNYMEVVAQPLDALDITAKIEARRLRGDNK